MPPRQSRRAIIFRSAALFIVNPATTTGLIIWSPALSRNKNRSPKPNEIVGTAIKKQLSFQYAELVRLREAVQQAEAALRGREKPVPDLTTAD
jgi:hypothetical protein